jgi:hypothetical protein
LCSVFKHIKERTLKHYDLITAKKVQIKNKQSEGLFSPLFVFYSTKKNRMVYKQLVSLEFIAHSNLGITEVF